MIGRLAPTKAVCSLPPGFVRNFVEGGWRQVERRYGTSKMIWTWVEMAGGAEYLQKLRRDHIKERTDAAKAALFPTRRARAA